MNHYSSLVGGLVSTTPFVFGDISRNQIVPALLITFFLATGVFSWRWFLARITTQESESEALALTQAANFPIAASTEASDGGAPEPGLTDIPPLSFGVR